MRALDTNKLKAEIIRQLKYLSEWTDNGECREYSDIDTERATEIADEIIKECGGNTQPDTGSGLHLAGVSNNEGLESSEGVGFTCKNCGGHTKIFRKSTGKYSCGDCAFICK